MAQQSNQGDVNGNPSHPAYDAYAASNTSMTSTPGPQQNQVNPYAQDGSAVGGASYYQNSANYTQPLQYHLYTSLGPHKENLLSYQRTSRDLFIPDSLREDLQRKSAATLQTLPNSTLPLQIDHFHSLVPLDTSNSKNAALFGYPSWIYKAVSSKDGHTYALRRLEGFRLTNEKAIRTVQNWKRVNNGNVVTIIDAFTNRSFGDSSLILVTDYHPLSKTLIEQHLTSSRFSSRPQASTITEQLLWSYTVQIANALKAIHSVGLAARVVDLSKVILTSKNRIRLNACAILDIVQFDSPRNVIDLQHEDLAQFGKLVLSLGTSNLSAVHNLPKAMEQFARSYSPQLKDQVFWLLKMATSNTNDSIDSFINAISSHLITAFDSTLHLDDELNSQLNRELENSRIVRLITKLNFINERPDYNHNRDWAETGERYPLKLFRDYVWHQVDSQGSPVLDLGHVLSCLNKLDAGSEEMVQLTSRDEQTCVLVSFKELKRNIEGAFQELLKASRRAV
ncbi:PAB-dependent poly(A)-specific ribonuclease subunit 3 [Loxospora ochrophaea]|nr:PAB-dependent poly(A)-specific ribonuclease subunit 3 [Loxospora ochrophaea]